MRTLLLLLFTLTGALTGSFAQADERIVDFQSDIVIAADSTMTVTETIRVNAEGSRIRRGIYRDFPTAYRDTRGRRVNVQFLPIDVTRNGEPEPWHAEAYANGIRVYFGSADVYLPSGEHTYALRYRTTRQLGFFDDHDELYWNVTGNGWDFFIDRASATVRLPGDAGRDRVRVEAYTGPQGSKDSDATTGVDEDGHAVAATRHPLPPLNGLTIVAMFPKGIVNEPTLIDQARWFGLDNRREAIVLGGLVLLTLFLFAQWWRVGRDPPTGTIFPQYDPPPDVSAGTARFISEMNYDDRCFAADVVQLGVAGALEIRSQGSSYELRQLRDPRAEVPEATRKLHQLLFAKGRTLHLVQSNHERIGKIKREHQKHYDTTYAKPNFRRNDGIGCLGFLVSIGVITAALLLDTLKPNAAVVMLTIGTGLLAMLVCGAIYTVIAASRQQRRAIGWLVTTIILSPVLAAAAYFLSTFSSVAFAVLVAAICAVQVPFGYWLRAPTVAGRKLLDRIDGLRMYMTVAERDDLARAKAPPMTVDEYQRLLPYAMALGVEKTWGDRLAAVMGASAVAAAGAGMAWYHGSSGRHFDAGNFGSSLGSSLSSAISSSSSPPGSSSGGGGGGSSGGGGGGGGGGGW